VHHNFERPPADRCRPVRRDRLDLFLHPCLRGGIDATQMDVVFGGKRPQSLPTSRCGSAQRGPHDHVARHFNPERSEHQLGKGAGGHAGRSTRGPKRVPEHSGASGEVVLQRSGQVGVSGPWERQPPGAAGSPAATGSFSSSSSRSRFHDLDRNRASPNCLAVPPPESTCALSVSIFMRPPRPYLLPAPKGSPVHQNPDRRGRRQASPETRAISASPMGLTGC